MVLTAKKAGIAAEVICTPKYSIGLNLNDANIIYSPYYYLQQNDIVYVEPKYKKKDGEDKAIQYISILTSLASTAAAVLWYITRQQLNINIYYEINK